MIKKNIFKEGYKMSYVDEVLAKVKEKNANEPEFLQAVEEVLNSIRPVSEFLKICSKPKNLIIPIFTDG